MGKEGSKTHNPPTARPKAPRHTTNTTHDKTAAKAQLPTASYHKTHKQNYHLINHKYQKQDKENANAARLGCRNKTNPSTSNSIIAPRGTPCTNPRPWAEVRRPALRRTPPPTTTHHLATTPPDND